MSCRIVLSSDCTAALIGLMLLDAGGAETLVHATASLQDEDDAPRQSTHFQATRWTKDRTPVLAAGVPPQKSVPAVGGTVRQRCPRTGAGVQDSGGVDQQCRGCRAAGNLGRRTHFRRHFAFV